MLHTVIFAPPAAPLPLDQSSTAELQEPRPAARNAKAPLTAGATLLSAGEPAHVHAGAFPASSCFFFGGGRVSE